MRSMPTNLRTTHHRRLIVPMRGLLKLGNGGMSDEALDSTKLGGFKSSDGGRP